MKSFFKHVVVSILIFEARVLLARKRPGVIAITGNVGKTSTKDAIYAVISKKVHARKSEKSYNSEIGVPLTILGLPNAWNNPLRWAKNIVDGAIIALFPGKYPQWLVLEVGVDRPGDIARMRSIVRPDIVVMTRLPDVPVHVEYFASPEAVIEEKRQLVDALKPDGTFIFNNDDEQIVKIRESIRQKSFGFSRYSPSPFAVSADEVMYGDDGVATGLQFTVTHGNEQAVIDLPGSLGVQHAYNFAAAVAVGSVLGIGLDIAAAALRGHTPPPGRMRLISGIKDALIIDDTYNASPTATERALQTLKEVKGKRKIAVLGDMLELGQYSVQEHERIGQQTSDFVDLLMTVGIRARGIAEAALELGLDEKKILQYEDSRVAGRELQQMLEKGDVVLVKGSQSMRMERTVEEIMLHPEDAKTLLVRQDRTWLTK